MKNKLKNNKGITLVALVVTIVVLLILAGVSINLVVGQNGIINKAKDAKKNYTDAAKKEEKELKDTDAWIDEQLGGNIPSITLPETAGSKPYLPTADFTKVEGTNLDNGLVIKDAKGNEYVWIEVPNDGTGPNYQGLTKKAEYDSQEYKKMEEAIKEYTAVYREIGFDDVYYTDTTTGWFVSETDYNNAKNKMLKSVYENGGFYIGRYEAGIGTNRTAAEEEASIEPMSKPNVYPYNYVTRTQAKVLAEKLSTAEYTNTLMFGMQWDLVLKYLETKEIPGTPNYLTENSKGWGNYYDAEIKNINSSAKGSNDYGETYNFDLKQGKPINTDILLTTGASEYTNKQNIYDLAGNEWEWTLEKADLTFDPCAYRGGCYSDVGSDYPASYCNYFSTSFSRGYVGFRFSLYK